MDSPAAIAMKILVVDDDSTCLAVVAALLRKWNFQVVTVKDPREALIIVGGVEGGFDVVIADVHMPEMNGFQLQQQITTDFQLPVILMSVDDRDNLVGRGVDFGATLFISKPVSVNDVRRYLCQIKKDDDQNSNIYIIPPPHHHGQATAAAAPTRRSTDNNNNSTEITREGEVTFKTNKLTGKKKLVWTPTLHYKFLDAITIIGLNNAAPKKILDVMDVPGITRDHVASHLQKYRMLLRRVSELTMPASQRNYNVDWGFGSGVNLSPRIAAPRRYGGGMFSLINNLQASLGGGAGRWNIISRRLCPQLGPSHHHRPFYSLILLLLLA
nr:two-component response regulator ARR14-like [Ipomoea batatas]